MDVASANISERFYAIALAISLMTPFSMDSALANVSERILAITVALFDQDYHTDCMPVSSLE